MLQLILTRTQGDSGFVGAERADLGHVLSS